MKAVAMTPEEMLTRSGVALNRARWSLLFVAALEVEPDADG
jgi:hypothetical protein